jgi:hypothetical protein
MKRCLARLVLAVALALPGATLAQAIPDAVRDAGVTVIQWQSVLAEVRRSAAEKHISEKALGVVCAKMGVELAKNHHFDLNQMISLISGRADEINALYEKLTLEEQQNDPAAANVLRQARVALDAGDLGQAETLLKQAGAAARSAVENAERQEAEITATEAQLKALQFDYLAAAATYGEAASELPATEAKARWSYLLKQGEMLRTRGQSFDESQPLRDAIAVYDQAALPLVPRDAQPIDWALTQKERGYALMILGDLGDDRALQDAIAAERAALDALSSDPNPEDKGRVENNLGIALLSLAERGDPKALDEAVAVLRSAVDAFPRDRDRAMWATAEANLGNALLTEAERGNDQALVEAVKAARAVAEALPRDQDPARWALAQDNLGMALIRMGQHGGDERTLHDAVFAFQAELTVRDRERDPANWARAQSNLSVALQELGSRGDLAADRQAVAAIRSALEVWTREQDPNDWALAENNLGYALGMLGARGNDPNALNDAVAAETAAVEVETRDRAPALWAAAQVNLGRALAELGQRGDRQALAKSVTAFEQALEVYSAAEFAPERSSTEDLLAKARALEGQSP